METDTEVKSFTVLDKQRKKLLDISRRSFKYLSKPTKETIENGQIATERLELPIFKAVLDKGTAHKWQFYYRGIKTISASITDEKFLERVNNGERFGRGDTLDADMEILKELDDKLGVLVNKSYRIICVHEIQRRKVQDTLPTI